MFDMTNRNCRYSVYIRTLGRGGDKYSKLLQSIDSQTVKPEEVVVVLPHGFRPPEERLGYERFAYCEKGMVRQRVFAINDAKTPYVLLLDDDVEFEPQYVEKIFKTMVTAGAQCCIPVLNDNSLRSSFVRRLAESFIGVATYKDTHDQWYVKINRCGGLVLNSNMKPDVQYYSQTGHGSNCFAETAALRGMRFGDELWLEDSGYPLPEDQVMFYKLYKSGVSIAVCRDAYFRHLDAASTNDGRRYLGVAKAKAGNYLIFWYRFIYLQSRGLPRLWNVLAICHRLFWESLLGIVKNHNKATAKSVFSGIKYGLAYIHNNKDKH